MSKSIEIFENTLLKLLVRSGTDSDRKTITLDTGELGYTTDAKRLFIGDGVTLGGKIVGNIYNGSRPDITSGAGTPMIGDIAFNSNTSSLYRLSSTNPTLLTNWELIGGVYTGANSTIKINSTNMISVCAISAFNISRDALGNSLTLNSGRVTLSSTIVVNQINTGTTFLALPSALQINTHTYKFPSSPLSGDTFLATDGSGNLRWSNINTFLSAASAKVTLGSGLTATVNGVPTSNFSLITSANVTINGLFIPTAHTTFTQAGSSVRSVGIASVVTQTFSDVSGIIGSTINGLPVEESLSRFDYARTAGPGVYGYLITTTTPFNPASVVIDINAKNAAYVYDAGPNNSFKTFSPVLVPFYNIRNSTQILVTFYVPKSNASGESLNPTITTGYNNINTRFSITIYG